MPGAADRFRKQHVLESGHLAAVGSDAFLPLGKKHEGSVKEARMLKRRVRAKRLLLGACMVDLGENIRPRGRV